MESGAWILLNLPMREMGLIDGYEWEYIERTLAYVVSNRRGLRAK